MRTIPFFFSLVVTACGSGKEDGSPRVREPLPQEELTDYQSCTEDSDCVFAQNGCCDCANGGRETAVRADQLEAFRDRFDCSHVACTMVGRVPPCGCGIVSCVEGLCSYAVDGPGCDDIQSTCGVDLGLTDANLVEIDGNGFEVRWTAEVAAGRLTLAWEGGCGDECSETREIVLANAMEPCPTFESAHVTERECGSPKGCVETTTWALDGTLEIQDFDLSVGPISGRITSEELDLTFYWRI